MTLPQGRAPNVHPGPIVAGVVLIAVAFGMLFDGTEGVDVRFGRLIGPLVMIAMGTLVVLRTDGRNNNQQRWIGGMWLIGIGCWLLISHTHVFGLTFHTSWPLLLVLAGTLTAVRGWR